MTFFPHTPLSESDNNPAISRCLHLIAAARRKRPLIKMSLQRSENSQVGFAAMFKTLGSNQSLERFHRTKTANFSMLTVKSLRLFANYSSAASGKVHQVNTIYKTTVTVGGIDQVMRKLAFGLIGLGGNECGFSEKINGKIGNVPSSLMQTN